MLARDSEGATIPSRSCLIPSTTSGARSCFNQCAGHPVRWALQRAKRHRFFFRYRVGHVGQTHSVGIRRTVRIPFSSLYFAKADPGETRTWGIILGAQYSHANESAYWPQSNHSIAGRLTQDIAADGFRDIEHGENLHFSPYSLARNLRQLDIGDPTIRSSRQALQGYSGLDAKFILHNSLVLDTTVNPDFSQVGMDNPATPNQRFPPVLRRSAPVLHRKQQLLPRPRSVFTTRIIS